MSSIENKNFSFNEMMVHVPLCTHKEASNILVVGSVDAEFKEEVNKHKLKVTYTDLAGLKSHNEKDLDLIIITSEKIDELLLANIAKILKDDGLIAFKSTSYAKDSEKIKDDLKCVGELFWIVMPFSFGHTTAILASKKYHPTADIILQRSDLLDDLNYYSTEVQHASFVFPAHITKDLTGIAKR